MSKIFIEISNQAIFIDEKPVFIMAHDFNYYSLDEKLWEMELNKLKSAGFNTISLIIPWKWHEIEENVYDFLSPLKNITDIFQICKKLSLFILIRPVQRTNITLDKNFLPSWLIENYSEIIDFDSNGNQIFQSTNKIPFIAFLHPQYFEKLKNWYFNLIKIIKDFQYPNGNIIMFQIGDEIGNDFQDQYFTFGYLPIYLEYYSNWLRQKYVLIIALNDLYQTNYSNFDQIKPPLPPFNKKSEDKERNFDQKAILKYFDWLEFKEWLICEFLDRIINYIREYTIYIPLFLNINSNKSPMYTKKILRYKSLKYEGNNILIGFNFASNIFYSKMDLNCESSWYIEWLKTHRNNLPFLSQFQEYDKNLVYSPINTYNLIRLSLIHGIKAISYTDISYLEKKRGEIVNLRNNELNKINQVVQINHNLLINLKKTYDQLTIAFYHPYSRLNSFNDKISSKNFSFNINYNKSKENFDNIFHLISKSNVNYDIIDLEDTEEKEISRKPFIVIYFLGWMDHKTMVLLHNYIKEGGTLISFGDIPTLNENLEEDLTLYTIYSAQTTEEENVKECYWIGHSSEKLITKINQLFSYKLDFINKAQILCHDGNYGKIYSFRRNFQKGAIIHSGIMFSSEFSSIYLLIGLFEEINFPLPHIFTSKECIANQSISDQEERLLCIGNLSQAAIENISFNFYNPNALKYPKNVEIDEINLEHNLIHLWHVNKSITNTILVELCTAEIFNINKENDYVFVNARFPKFQKSSSLFAGTLILHIENENQKFNVLEGNPSFLYIWHNDEKFKECVIKFNDTFEIELVINNLEFHFKIQADIISQNTL